MDDRYRVVLIVPAGYKHSLCFTEAAFLLKNSLADCGAGCDIVVNEMARDRINIILGYHLLVAGDYLRAYRYIPWQLEQLSAAEGVFSGNVKAVLSGAMAVWDYSQENIAFLAGHGITAKHLPVGYHRGLEQISRTEMKDIDVLFFGSKGDRRKKVLEELAARGAKVQALFGVYGKERDAYVARARIVLNIHYYSSKIFEAVRVSYLLNNACCVVSEESDVYPYSEVTLPLVPYERLTEQCLSLIARKEEIWEIGERNYGEFRKSYPMIDLIKKVIED
jgi:hypothetical protein